MPDVWFGCRWGSTKCLIRWGMKWDSTPFKAKRKPHSWTSQSFKQLYFGFGSYSLNTSVLVCHSAIHPGRCHQSITWIKSISDIIRKTHKNSNQHKQSCERSKFILNDFNIRSDKEWGCGRPRVHLIILLFAFKSFTCLAPPYLPDLLQPHTPRCSLRSADQLFLTVPRTRQRRRGDRAVGPKLRNDLPLQIRQVPSSPVFKTHLRSLTFNTVYWADFVSFYLLYFYSLLFHLRAARWRSG